jgi:hypothetical protein
MIHPGNRMNPTHTAKSATIDLRIRTLAQLYDAMDPAPFHEKSLDEKAARYLLESAREHPGNVPLRVVLHLPESLRDAAHDVPAAIHNHFRFEVEQLRRDIRWRMGAGWRALFLGVTVLGVCLFVGSLLATRFAASDHAGFRVLDEGLLILGWVALWKPLEILLFDRFEMRASMKMLRRLAVVPVEMRFVE